MDSIRSRLHWRALLRAPFAVSGAALAWQAWNSHLALDLFSLLQGGGVGLALFLALRRWSPFLVCALLLTPLAWHFTVGLPATDTWIRGAHPGEVVRLHAVIRDRWDLKTAEPRSVRLLISDVELRINDETHAITEMELEFPASSAWAFRSGRNIRLAGRMRDVSRVNHRLRVTLTAADHAFDDRPLWPTGEAWRIRLQDRANYYLSKRAAAVFLPLVLDVRDRRSVESREVAAEFRRVGVSHLFAISGMNVALIFGMLMVVSQLVLGRVQPGQGWVHARDVARAASVGLIWLYMALIGLPTPAVRAAIMGTALVWLDSRGARTPPLYVLLVTGLAMLGWSPGQFYEISFQLSFLAYTLLVLALQVGGSPPVQEGLSRLRAWVRQGLWLGAMNVGVTAIITLGMWPLIAAKFGTFSWLVFAGNLLLVPAMSAVIVPSAMVGLIVAAIYVGSAPETWLERLTFGWIEWSLRAWLWGLRWLDELGQGAVVRVSETWSGREVVLYYLALTVFLALLIRLRRQSAYLGSLGDRTSTPVL